MRRWLGLILVTLIVGCTSPSTEPAATSEPAGPVVSFESVPLLQSQPVVDGAFTTEATWQQSLRLSGEFVISDGRPGGGTFPLRLWLGQSENFLFVGVEVQQIAPNPSTTATERVPDDLDLHLLMGHVGPLVPPADWIIGHHFRHFGWMLEEGYWTGSGWEIQPAPEGAVEDQNEAEMRRLDVSNGTSSLSWEFRIPFTSPHQDYDGLQLTPEASDFRLVLRFERQDDPRGPDRADTWPGDGWTPDNHLDASTWLRLRITEPT